MKLGQITRLLSALLLFSISTFAQGMLPGVLSAQSAAGGTTVSIVSETVAPSAGSGTSSPSINTSTATAYVAFCSQFNNGTIPAPTDSVGSTYVAIGSVVGVAPVTLQYGQFFYVASPTTSTTYTITVSGPTGCSMYALKGTKTTSAIIDTGCQAGTTWNSSSSDALAQPGNCTPTQTGEFIFFAVSYGNSSQGWTVNDSFTLTNTQQNFGPYVQDAYIITGSTSTINPTFSSAILTTDGGTVLIQGFEHL
jgi:hypothetical protein